MKFTRSLAVLALASIPLASQAALEICWDDGSDNTFNYNASQCVVDESAGDAASGIVGLINKTFNLGGSSVAVESAFGEPLFGPGFGFALSTDGPINGSFIFAIGQTDLAFGAAPASSLVFGSNFTGSINGGAGTATYSVYVDDANSGLSAGNAGVLVNSGNVGTSSSGSATVTDPFSMKAFITLTSAGGAFFSTDLTTNVPEPGSLALVGLALAGVGFGARRKAK